MALHHFPRIITDGLVLCLDAGNPLSYSGSGSTWTDLSGNGYNGTISNVSYNFSNKGFFTFNGTNSYITTTLDSVAKVGSMPLTIELWINSDSATPVGIFDSAPNYQNVLRNYSSGKVEWWSASPSVNLNLSASTWYQLLFVFRFNTNRYIDYYKNGSFISTSTGSTTSTFTWSGLRFGDINNGTAGRYAGKLSIARIYNKLFSATDVLENFNATKGRYGL
jgi:hypothetical protein